MFTPGLPGFALSASATPDEKAASIAANLAPNLFGCAFNLGRLVELIEEDDALPVQEITLETRQAAADALRDAGTHWSTIGRHTNTLDDKLPPPTPLEDPNEP